MPPGAVVATAGEALRHDPDSHGRSYGRRRQSELPFDPLALPDDAPLMLDTTVYIHRLQRKIPAPIGELVARRQVLHCGVAIQEIAVSVGLMDPFHAATAANRPPLVALLNGIGTSDMREPSAAAWAEAGMLAGILARTQLGLARAKDGLTAAEICCQKGKRRELLNDALIFLCAAEQGAVLVTANVSDADLLLRLRPDAQVLLYRT